MLKRTKDTFFINFFSFIPMELSDPAPTYILPAKERRLLEKFQPDSFKTKRLVCVETDGQTDIAKIDSASDPDQEYTYFRSSGRTDRRTLPTPLVMLIKNIYILWVRKSLLHCVANF